MVNSFQKKIDYLSDKYEIYECKIRWVDYPAEQNRIAIRKGYDYEVLEARSWTAFKSLIKQKIYDGSYVGALFYESETRVIWFNTLEWIDFGSYQLTIYFIKG